MTSLPYSRINHGRGLFAQRDHLINGAARRRWNCGLSSLRAATHARCAFESRDRAPRSELTATASERMAEWHPGVVADAHANHSGDAGEWIRRRATHWSGRWRRLWRWICGGRLGVRVIGRQPVPGHANPVGPGTDSRTAGRATCRWCRLRKRSQWCRLRKRNNAYGAG